MRAIAENLATVGQVMSDDELILYILSGLESEYDPVAVNLTARQDSLSLQEVLFLLQSQEMRLEQHNTSISIGVPNPYTNVAYNKKNSKNDAQNNSISLLIKVETISEAKVDDAMVVVEAALSLSAKFVTKLVTWLLDVIFVWLFECSSTGLYCCLVLYCGSILVRG